MKALRLLLPTRLRCIISVISKSLSNNLSPERKLPEVVEVAPTSRNEQRDIEFELDQIKRKNDPDFKGAFHEKKIKFSKEKKPQHRNKKHRKPKRR